MYQGNSQDSMLRSPECPTHITTTFITSNFTRDKEWSYQEREKSYLVGVQFKDAVKHQRKASQEISMYFLDQIRSMNRKIDNIGFDGTVMPSILLSSNNNYQNS